MVYHQFSCKNVTKPILVQRVRGCKDRGETRHFLGGNGFFYMWVDPNCDGSGEKTATSNSELILVSLVKYIRQLPSPEYVYVKKNIGMDIALS